ncbi:MAG: hypothetical protein WCJ71_07170 [Candidatus Omnitrophota bacterium]
MNWKRVIPQGFESEDAYVAFIDAKVQEAFEAYLIGACLTPAQQKVVRAFGEWCSILGVMGQQLDTKEKVEKWDRVSRRSHNRVQSIRIERQLRNIARASQNRP